MIRFVAFILFFLGTSAAQLIDRTQALPQTPRQALLEILQSKDGATIEKHLPEVTRKKLRELRISSGAGSALMIHDTGFAGLARTPGEKMEVFEAGPILARLENARTSEKVEISIENEDFRGDQTDLELAFHMYKGGDEFTHWYMPRILLQLKQEAGIWRITEIGFSARLPIGNAEFLEAMTKEWMKGQRMSDSAAAIASMRAVITAQMQYASSYPGVGFTCTLANLGSEGIRPGSRKQQPNELHAMLIDDVLASGQKSGYKFSLSNCVGPPATRFVLTAVPETPAAGQRAYCSDESGVIRFSMDGRAETCLASGKPF
jgi:hypothetical protein